MISKLKSHLRKEKGFTLIELLIVIAIIAILVVVVIVAINPVQRLRDAADRRASSNVRSAGTLIEACITSALSATPTGTLADCDDIAGVNATGQGNVPTSVAISANAGVTNVCSIQEGATGRWFRFQHVTGEVGPVIVQAANPGCP